MYIIFILSFLKIIYFQIIQYTILFKKAKYKNQMPLSVLKTYKSSVGLKSLITINATVVVQTSFQIGVSLFKFLKG